ncbi:MAG: HI0074 family nucleotidyltransferase substrate-binding subunit [Alphaproteobacteria bacterium]|nr:HI0074 family nucleotidyltransferase substrate-binding subunit [Alphaproteobacteria bacterium]
MKLNLTSLESAVFQLGQSLNYYNSDIAEKDEGIKKQFCMASIQAFEYTYELCHKMLKRYLEMTEPNSESIDFMTFPELIRTGSEKGLLKSDWGQWKQYRDIRNITSHTYDNSKANIAIGFIPDFLVEAKFLLGKLKDKSSMPAAINVNEKHAKIVTEILKKFLPTEVSVWVFGSRTQNTTKQFSDLDLAIDCHQKPLGIDVLSDLRNAFDESLLPYKVDLVDMNATGPEFLDIINEKKILWDLGDQINCSLS